MKELRKEVDNLTKANEILEKSIGYHVKINENYEKKFYKIEEENISYKIHNKNVRVNNLFNVDIINS